MRWFINYIVTIQFKLRDQIYTGSCFSQDTFRAFGEARSRTDQKSIGQLRSQCLREFPDLIQLFIGLVLITISGYDARLFYLGEATVCLELRDRSVKDSG